MDQALVRRAIQKLLGRAKSVLGFGTRSGCMHTLESGAQSGPLCLVTEPAPVTLTHPFLCRPQIGHE
jgi:hypothetical protein